jgi:hypothetical protein
MPIKKFDLPIHGIVSTYAKYVDTQCDIQKLTESIKTRSEKVLETSRESLTAPMAKIFGIFRNDGNIVLNFPTDSAFLALYIPEVDKVIIGVRVAHPTNADLLTNNKFFKRSNQSLKNRITELTEEDRSFVTMFCADNPKGRKWIYWCIAKGATEI